MSSLVPIVMVSGCSVLSWRVRHHAEFPSGVGERVQHAGLIDARNKVMGAQIGVSERTVCSLVIHVVNGDPSFLNKEHAAHAGFASCGRILTIPAEMTLKALRI